MDAYKGIIYSNINKLRQQYNLGNYCGRSIFDIVEKIEIDGRNPFLFRLPFKNNELSGFVGYKNGRFSVFTNSSKTLGYEIFTAAHEIYHLIENATIIKQNIVVEEVETIKKEASEAAADIFAAELLMPEADILKEYERLMKFIWLKNPDEALIINLQQEYYVEYKAVTKRLKELCIIDSKTEEKLNKILVKETELFKLTKKLGYSNQLNKPAKKVYLPMQLLKAVEANYKSGNTTFDDLIVLFSYCDLSPQDFGYEEEELTDDAKTLAEKIKAQLGSESVGKE